MSECVSCGAEANPNSPRDFCNSCENDFATGLERQARIEERADRLETAKAEGNPDAVGEIMTEIFRESMVQEQPNSQPVSSAIAEKVEE